MSVSYKLYQEKRTNSSRKGQWYARACHVGVVTTEQLAEIMQANCTLKKSDIVAVISELVDVMRTQLQNSMKVKLTGFGTFKITMRTKPAKSPKEFTPKTNIKGLKVLFLPEMKVDAKHKRTHRFLENVQVKEALKYNVVKPKNVINESSSVAHS